MRAPTFLRSALVLAAALSVLALFEACGATRPACGPGVCDGCCTAAGQCVTLTSPSQCGVRGEACRACSLTQSCSFGTCIDAAGAGNAGGGSAVGGGQGGGSSAGGVGGGSSAGGVGGGSSAGGAGGGSSAGGAGGGADTCAGSCNGCCDGTGCRPGATDTSCGSGGQRCDVCRGSQRCEIFRFCRDSACAGCVDDTGACVAGTSPTACGTTGLLCRVCGPNATCVNGICVASSCAGCRLNTGACLAGNELWRCGTGGATCAFCTTECRAGACVGSTGSDAGVDAGTFWPDAGPADDGGFVRVGNAQPFTTDTTHPVGIVYGYAMNVPERLQLTHLAAFGRSVGANIRLALYADFFGTPTTLVASTAFAPLALGPVEIPIAAPVTVDAGTYWIMGAVDANSPIGFGGLSVNERLFSLPSAQPFPTSYPTNGSQRLNPERNYYLVGRR